MSNVEIIKNQIEEWKEGGVEATSITVVNPFFMNLCNELKIKPENCINPDNYGEIILFGVKIITDLPILTH